MFGTWRLVLAFEVVVFHLLSVPVIGAYAVISFFVLSGFLMTTIMQETYGYSRRGLRAYAANRALRLYPGLWFACAISIAMIGILGAEHVASYHPALRLPETPIEWFENLSLVYLSPLPINVEPRLAPPTWALTVELTYYAAIGLGLSRFPRLTLAWLIASLAYFAVCFAFDLSLRSVYGSVPGGSLAFAIGAMAYHHRDRIADRLAGIPRALPLLVAARYAVIAAAIGLPLVGLGDWRAREALNIVNALLSMGVIVLLFDLRAAGAAKRADNLLGDFSYPVYLLHWQAGAIASFVLYGEAVRGRSVESLLSFGLAMVVLFALCMVGVFLIDRRIRAIRDRVRARAGASGGARIVEAASPP